MLFLSDDSEPAAPATATSGFTSLLMSPIARPCGVVEGRVQIGNRLFEVSSRHGAMQARLG